MPYLATLSLQNANAVTDAGCAAIARIAPLRTLNLKNCPAMSDKGLAALAPLKRLSHLRLQGNQVRLVAEVLGLLQLCDKGYF